MKFLNTNAYKKNYRKKNYSEEQKSISPQQRVQSRFLK